MFIKAINSNKIPAENSREADHYNNPLPITRG